MHIYIYLYSYLLLPNHRLVSLLQTTTYQGEIFLHITRLLVSLGSYFLQSFSLLASTSLLPAVNKHTQISSVWKSISSCPGLRSLSLFSCFWRIFYSNYLYFLASHSHFLQTMKSWLLLPTHHTLASTLKNSPGNSNPWPPQCPVCQLSRLIWLVLSVPFENGGD